MCIANRNNLTIHLHEFHDAAKQEITGNKQQSTLNIMKCTVASFPTEVFQFYHARSFSLALEAQRRPTKTGNPQRSFGLNFTFIG